MIMLQFALLVYRTPLLLYPYYCPIIPLLLPYYTPITALLYTCYCPDVGINFTMKGQDRTGRGIVSPNIATTYHSVLT